MGITSLLKRFNTSKKPRIPSKLRYAMGRLPLNDYDKEQAIRMNLAGDSLRFKKELFSTIQDYLSKLGIRSNVPGRKSYQIAIISSGEIIYLTFHDVVDMESVAVKNCKIKITVRISLFRGISKKIIATKELKYRLDINKYSRKNWDVVRKELLAWVENQFSKLGFN